jgi:acetyl esterase
MTIVLEPAAQALADATAKPPFLYELTPGEARKVLEDLQAGPIASPRSTRKGWWCPLRSGMSASGSSARRA